MSLLRTTAPALTFEEAVAAHILADVFANPCILNPIVNQFFHEISTTFAKIQCENSQILDISTGGVRHWQSARIHLEAT